MRTFALGLVALFAVASCSDDGYQGGGRGAPGAGGGGSGADPEVGTEDEVPPDPAFDDDVDDPLAAQGETP